MTKHETKFLNAYRIEAREVRKVTYTVEGASLTEAIAKFSQQNPQAIDVTSIVCVGAAIEMLKPVAQKTETKRTGRPKGKLNKQYTKGKYNNQNPIPPSVVSEIRALAKTTPHSEVAAAYGVSKSTVQAIHYRTGRHKVAA